jgi:hypothetical protein
VYKENIKQVRPKLSKEASPIKVSKKDFFKFLKNKMRESELCWVTTDVCNFEWSEINLNKPEFIKQLKLLKFKKAYVGFFNQKTKKTEYFGFDIKSE